MRIFAKSMAIAVVLAFAALVSAALVPARADGEEERMVKDPGPPATTYAPRSDSGPRERGVRSPERSRDTSRRDYRRDGDRDRYRERRSERHYYDRDRRRDRHDRDDFFLGLGTGLFGAFILGSDGYYYDRSYAPARHGWCHVHRYKVRGIKLHRNVRCHQHRVWRHDSILYVQ